jgi:cob(I)alamin adenosyltransferase
MPRITRVYTRTGDDGTTGLGGGQRVRKDSLRIETYGTVDELSSVAGVALSAGLVPRLDGVLRRIQNDLFNLGSDLCILEEDKARMPVPTIEQRHVDALESLMDELSPISSCPGGRRAPPSSTSPAPSAAAPSGCWSRCSARRRWAG